MNIKLKKRWLLLLAPCLIALAYQCGILHYVSVDYFKAHHQFLTQFIAHHYTMAAFLYSVFFALLIFLMLPVTLVVTIIGGFLFGAIAGTFLSMAGALIGGTLSVLTTRYLLYDWLHTRHHTTVTKFQEKFNQHGIRYLISLELFPLTPFPIINIIAGLSNLSITTYMWSVALGLLPVTIFCSAAGQHLSTISSIQDVLSPRIVGLFSLLSLVILAPTIVQGIQRLLKHKNSKK